MKVAAKQSSLTARGPPPNLLVLLETSRCAVVSYATASCAIAAYFVKMGMSQWPSMDLRWGPSTKRLVQSESMPIALVTLGAEMILALIFVQGSGAALERASTKCRAKYPALWRTCFWLTHLWLFTGFALLVGGMVGDVAVWAIKRSLASQTPSPQDGANVVQSLASAGIVFLTALVGCG